MSRKLTLTFALATAATIAAASLGSSTADARGFGGGFGGGRVASGGFHGGHIASSGRTLTPILGRTGNPGRIGNPRFPRWPGHPGHQWAYHPHGHLVFRGGRWITIDEVVDEAPVTPVSGPCTCLTKTYTADGLVVFADVCTKEAASARVDDSEDTAKPADKSSDATEEQPAVAAAPTSQNYAGRTYQDYLAANGKAASEAKLKN